MKSYDTHYQLTHQPLTYHPSKGLVGQGGLPDPPDHPKQTFCPLYSILMKMFMRHRLLVNPHHPPTKTFPGKSERLAADCLRQ